MKRTACCLAAVLILAGCATIAHDQRAQYLAASEAFTGVVQSLAYLRAEGAFSVDEADRITELIRVGKDGLIAWSDALLAGRDDTAAREAVLEALRTLMLYQETG